MAHQTGISGMPTLIDMGSAFSMFVTDFFQSLLGNAQTTMHSAVTMIEDNGSYDAHTKSYMGDDGLQYRVPLHMLPSDRHCRQRIPNIKILMDNVRSLCMNNDLPSTPEEKKFWASYRFVKYQTFLAPLSCILPPVYLTFKIVQNKIPPFWRGRSVPVSIALAITEQIAEQTYPAHQLLCTALKQKTPLGDAARAEWQRLQPVPIPFHIYSSYQIQHFFGNTPQELQFGGDVVAFCNT